MPETRKSTMQALEEQACATGLPADDAALELARRDQDSQTVPEFVVAHVPEGEVTVEVFDRLADAFAKSRLEQYRVENTDTQELETA